MKKLIAVMQKKGEKTREEMAEKLEEILIPIAEVLNDETPVYHGFPVETMTLKGSDEVFIIGFNNIFKYCTIFNQCSFHKIS